MWNDGEGKSGNNIGKSNSINKTLKLFLLYFSESEADESLVALVVVWTRGRRLKWANLFRSMIENLTA